jgi:hypothetical protein
LRCPHHRHFIIGCECNEIAVAHDVDRRTGRPPDRGFIEVREPGPGPRTTQHARMQHVIGREIMDEGGTCHLVREVEPRQALPHNAIFRRRLGRRIAGRRAGKVDLRGDRPVILTEVANRAQETAVLADESRSAGGDPQQETRSYLGADEANGAARDGDRIAA